MSKLRTALVLIISFFLFGCATANRSARKIEPGTVTLSYIPLLSASARVALSKHVESRLSVWVDRPVFDVFVRTADDQRLLNFGAALGTVLPVIGAAQSKKTYYFASFTVSNRFGKRFFPYLTYSYFSDFKQNKNNMHELALGCETIVYQFEESSNAIIVTPEVTLLPTLDIYPFNTKFGGTLGIGFSFKL